VEIQILNEIKELNISDNPENMVCSTTKDVPLSVQFTASYCQSNLQQVLVGNSVLQEGNLVSQETDEFGGGRF
jgi:hypothetical protein